MNLYNKLKEKYTLENNNVSILLLILIVVNVVSIIISNIIAIKNIDFFGLEINGAAITLSSSIIIFPLTYILSDIFSEIYGYTWSRITCWLGFLMNLIVVIFCKLTILMPGAGQASDAFKVVFSESPGILAASLLAFIVGDFCNDVVFQAMKSKAKNDKTILFVVRSILSSLVGEVVDTLFFLSLLYLFTHQYGTTITNFWQFIAIVLIQAGLKAMVELVLVPITIIVIKYVRQYENKRDIEQA